MTEPTTPRRRDLHRPDTHPGITTTMGPPPGRVRKVTPPRVRRRRLLFWLSLVPAIVVLSYGIHFTSLNATFARAEAHYAAGDYWEAYEVFKGMRSPNLVDPWKAHFNVGTAAFREDMLFVAELSLDEALELVPEEHRCDVQTNRALVLEASGEDYKEQAETQYTWALAQREAEAARMRGEPYDATLFELDYDDTEITSTQRFEDAALDQYFAADYFARAAEAINDPACQGASSPDASQEEQEQAEQEQQQREAEQDRLEEEAQSADDERKEMEREASGEPAEEEPQPEPDDGETEEERQAREEQERQEELEQRNKDANEEAEAGDGEGGGGSSGDDDGDGGSTGPISNW